MKRETRQRIRGPLAGFVAVACIATLALADSAAAPASGVAVKVVTLKFGDRGKGDWNTLGPDEKGSLSLTYAWTGSVTLKVPASQASGRGTLNARGTAVLTGTWTGDYSGTRFVTPDMGPYHCTYKASNVTIRVAASPQNGPSSKTLAVILTRGAGFFPGHGDGAEANCDNSVGKDGPPHFEPQWLFRDNVSDHYRLSSNTAYLVLPRTLLTGKSVAARFPNEVGSTKVALGPAIDWHNVGRLTAKKS